MRRLSAVVGLVLAAVAAPAPAPAAQAPPGRACDGVLVAVQFNQLGGGTQSACVHHGGTAAQLFADAGFRLAYQPGMQDFVCTIQGRPDDRSCTTGTSYWSLWWSPGDRGWTYATLGVKSLDAAVGDSLAFTWHQGAAKAAAPDLPLGTTAPDARSPEPATDPGGGSSATTWLVVGGAVVVVGAAAAVPILRRRKAG